MLSPQAVAVAAEPDGRSAPEGPLDARIKRCRVGATGNRGQFRRHPGLMVPFGDGHQGYSTPKSTPASYLSGECRVKKLIIEARINECERRDGNPNVPWTPQEVASDAAKCREAGA